MGLRYTFFRVWLEFQRKTGLLLRKFPANAKKELNYSLDQWRMSSPNFLISPKAELNWVKIPDQKLASMAERIVNGEMIYFSRRWLKTEGEHKWHINPDNAYIFPSNIHWSKIQDFSQESGDIKFVWERSRFSWIITLIADDYHNEKDHAEWILNEITDWINKNPVNVGPNWRCSQEISLRLINWTYALHYFADSNFMTNDLFDKILNSIYWQVHHVYKNINFSLIAVRNNHAITETALLMLSEIMFPFLPNVKEWSRKGRKWFETEIGYQIYKDGTFLQFSLNYHRVVIQVLTLALALTEKVDKQLNQQVYQRAYSSLNFLFQCQAGSEGELPNYGANDGALFFPWSWQSDYRDYRPQLSSLHVFLTGKSLYKESGPWDMESMHWGFKPTAIHSFKPITKKMGWNEFSDGGFFVLNEKDSVTFIRCGKHKDRPSQADNLHVDIWYQGRNYLIDAGSYKYNAEPHEILYFSGTESHNTIMVNDSNQMAKGSRFIWLDWSQALTNECGEDAQQFLFSGSILAFKHIGGITHTRKISKIKDLPKWEIQDDIYGVGSFELKQNWHFLPEFEKQIEIVSTGHKSFFDGWYSTCYGEKSRSRTISYRTNKKSIWTKIELTPRYL